LNDDFRFVRGILSLLVFNILKADLVIRDISIFPHPRNTVLYPFLGVEFHLNFFESS